MARANDLVSTGLIKRGIELYTGRFVDAVKRVADPAVAGSMALRAVYRDGTHADFLISADAPHMKIPEDVVAALEECEFETWPPRSGKPKFF